MTAEAYLSLLKTPKRTEAFHTKDSKTMKNLSYSNLKIEELENSDIPEENFYSATISGTRGCKLYDFAFTPSSKNKTNYIELDGKVYRLVGGKPSQNGLIIVTGQADHEIRDSKINWKLDKKSLKEVISDFHSLVKGSLDLEDKKSNCRAVITNPEINMTQNGIAQTAKRLKSELDFHFVNASFAHYNYLKPRNYKARDLGFNLPAGKIWDIIWCKAY